MIGYQHNHVISKAVADDLRIRRRYFDGPLMQVTAEWKAAAQAAIDSQGITKSDLARKIGADKSAITVLLRPATTVSRLVVAVSDALGIAQPLVGASMDASDIIELVDKLTEDDRARVLDYVRRLQK